MSLLVQETEPMMHKPNCQCPICRAVRGERKKRDPVFSVRLNAELQAWLRARPEGATAWLEALVTDAMAREVDGQDQGG